MTKQPALKIVSDRAPSGDSDLDREKSGNVRADEERMKRRPRN
jgi:hypothetical protein